MAANRPSRGNQRCDIADLFVTNGCEQLLECKDGEHLSFCILPKPASIKEPSQDHCDAIPVLQQQFVGSHAHIKAAALGNKEVGPHWAQCRTILLKKGAAVASACVFAVATMTLHGKECSALVVVYIATPPSFRRLGLARLLVAKLLDVQAQVAKQTNLPWHDPVFFTIVSNTKLAKSFWARCGFGRPKLDRMCDYISDGTFCFKNSFVWAYNNKDTLNLDSSIKHAKQKLGLIPSVSLSSNASAATPLGLQDASDCSPFNGKDRDSNLTSKAADGLHADMFDAIVIDNGPTSARKLRPTKARKASIVDSSMQHSPEADNSETETDAERTESQDPEEGTAGEKDSKEGTPDVLQPRRTARPKAGVITLPQHFVWSWDHKPPALPGNFWNKVANRNKQPAYVTGNLLQGAPELKQFGAAAFKTKYEDVPVTGTKRRRRSSQQTAENLYLKPRTSYRNRKPAATEREQSEDGKTDDEEASEGERETGSYLSAFRMLAELDKQAARMQTHAQHGLPASINDAAASAAASMELYAMAEQRLVAGGADVKKAFQADDDMQFAPGVMTAGLKRSLSMEGLLASEEAYDASMQGCKRVKLHDGRALPGPLQRDSRVLQVSIQVVQTDHAMELDGVCPSQQQAEKVEEAHHAAAVTVQLTVLGVLHNAPPCQASNKDKQGFAFPDMHLSTAKPAGNSQQPKACSKPATGTIQPSAKPTAGTAAGTDTVEEVVNCIRQRLLQEARQLPGSEARVTKLLRSLRQHKSKGFSLLDGLERVLSPAAMHQPNVTNKQHSTGVAAVPAGAQHRSPAKKFAMQAITVIDVDGLHKVFYTNSTQQQQPETSKKRGKPTMPDTQPGTQGVCKPTTSSSKRQNQGGTEELGQCSQSVSPRKHPACETPISEEGLQRQAQQLLSQSTTLMPLVKDLLLRQPLAGSRNEQPVHVTIVASSSEQPVDVTVEVNSSEQPVQVPIASTEQQPDTPVTPSVEQLGLNDMAIRQLLSRVAPTLQVHRQPASNG